MFFILDLTQVGCLPVELKDKNAITVERLKMENAFSLFNHIPSIDILKYNPKKTNSQKNIRNI